MNPDAFDRPSGSQSDGLFKEERMMGLFQEAGQLATALASNPAGQQALNAIVGQVTSNANAAATCLTDLNDYNNAYQQQNQTLEALDISKLLQDAQPLGQNVTTLIQQLKALDQSAPNDPAAFALYKQSTVGQRIALVTQIQALLTSALQGPSISTLAQHLGV